MPGLMTIVTLLDEDDDEFPITLPGVYPDNRGADIEAALQIAQDAKEQRGIKPNGNLRLGSIEYR